MNNIIATYTRGLYYKNYSHATCRYLPDNLANQGQFVVYDILQLQKRNFLIPLPLTIYYIIII